MAISEKTLQVLSLIARTKTDEQGWCKCTNIIFAVITKSDTRTLVEFDEISKRVRLSEEGKIIAKHCL